MPDLPAGTVTFLFSDIEGSTKLLQRLGYDYARVLGEHQALLRAAWAAHGGVEVDTSGDGFFVAFASAPEAVAAAAQATRALAEHSPIRVRIGLHTGTPQVVGSNYVGLDVHRAARIAAAGHGGQVLLSQTTRDLAEHDLPGGTSLRDEGAHRLKDLQHAERLYQLVQPGMEADFPPLKSLDARPHNLAVQRAPLLGRERELVAVTALLRRDDVQLVTLTGPGGIGKTRLSIQAAAEVLDDFADGVWFVRLSRLSDPALVVPTIAQTLGLREVGGQPIAETLREHLRDRRLLLVLDNFEQVVGAAPAVAGLLEAGADLKALVTSRTPLHLRGEHEYPLAPLPLPEPGQPASPEQLAQYAAVALFVERAREARPDFAVTATNAPAIAEVCARLDGLPLAIELAAARVRLLPAEALLARLSSRLLTGGARDAEERQRTMQATLAWSEDLLSPDERVLFRRLAVFAGGCKLEAAEAVCVMPEGARPLGIDVLDGLDALVDHSLVQQREEGGEPRFTMLHVIQEYALERLEVSGAEAEALRRAHAGYSLALAERAEPELTGPEQGRWLDRLEGEHDNLRAALGWARERAAGEAETGLRLVAALWRFWQVRGHLREGQAWAEGLLALAAAGGAVGAAPKPVRARALRTGGALAVQLGDDAAAGRWLEAATLLARIAGDRRTAAQALNDLGFLASRQGDLARAEARFEGSLALCRQLGDRHGEAMALGSLGDLAVYQGDLARAAAATEAALALFRQLGDRGHVGTVLGNLGWIARKRGDVAQAAALGREALALFSELSDQRRCAEALEHLAATVGVAGQGARAARLLGAVAAVRATLGTPQPPQERADMEAAVAVARAALGEEAWAAAYAAGAALSLDEAVAEALGDGEERREG